MSILQNNLLVNVIFQSSLKDMVIPENEAGVMSFSLKRGTAKFPF